ncbi:Mor transcription activator family protein [Leptolyngbyaceae cyanobacterium UHCC 1019]
MPQTFREVADVIGLQAAFALVGLCGGYALYVPKSIPPHHLLYQVLGEELAVKFAFHFGGDTLYLIKGDKLGRAERDKKIVARRQQAKIREIAEEFKLTERMVWRILARGDRQRSGDSQQLELL